MTASGTDTIFALAMAAVDLPIDEACLPALVAAMRPLAAQAAIVMAFDLPADAPVATVFRP